MQSILNATLLTLALSAGQIAAACFTDQRPAKTSTEAAISIALDQGQFKLGEPIILHAIVTNASKRPLTVTETSVEREFEIHIKDAQGAEPPLTEQGRNLRGKGKFPPVIYRNFQLTLSSGEALKGDQDISRVYSLSAPGEYKASVCRVVAELGPILSNVVSLTVTPQ